MFNKVLIKSVDKIRVHIAKQPKNTQLVQTRYLGSSRAKESEYYGMLNKQQK